MSTEDRAEGQADNVEGYELLRGILDEAYDQSARGKGHDRHANGRYFDQQPIMEIGRMVGPGFATGQVMKKAQEATSMAARGEADAAVRELLGVIVYAASAVALVREKAPRSDIDRRPDSGDFVSAMDAIIAHDRRRREAASEDRPFKVGDRVRWRGLWSSSYYTTGKVYEIKSGPHQFGDIGLTDDEQGTGAHSWPPEDLSKNFELVN